MLAFATDKAPMIFGIFPPSRTMYAPKKIECRDNSFPRDVFKAS